MNNAELSSAGLERIKLSLSQIGADDGLSDAFWNALARRIILYGFSCPIDADGKIIPDSLGRLLRDTIEPLLLEIRELRTRNE